MSPASPHTEARIRRRKREQNPFGQQAHSVHTHLPARLAVLRFPVARGLNVRVFGEHLQDLLHGYFSHINVNMTPCKTKGKCSSHTSVALIQSNAACSVHSGNSQQKQLHPFQENNHIGSSACQSVYVQLWWSSNSSSTTQDFSVAQILVAELVSGCEQLGTALQSLQPSISNALKTAVETLKHSEGKPFWEEDFTILLECMCTHAIHFHSPMLSEAIKVKHLP